MRSYSSENEHNARLSVSRLEETLNLEIHTAVWSKHGTWLPDQTAEMQIREGKKTNTTATAESTHCWPRLAVSLLFIPLHQGKVKCLEE